MKDITGVEAGQQADQLLDAEFGHDMDLTMPFEDMPSDGLGWDFGNDSFLPFSYE